jgi:hypothetical protein
MQWKSLFLWDWSAALGLGKLIKMTFFFSCLGIMINYFRELGDINDLTVSTHNCVPFICSISNMVWFFQIFSVLLLHCLFLCAY